MMTLFLVAVVAPAAVYALSVCVCVAGRMTCKTRAICRWPVLLLGGLACWALLRTLTGDWQTSLPDLTHALSVIIGAITLAILPRLSV